MKQKKNLKNPAMAERVSASFLNDEWLTISELAKLLGLHSQTIYRYVRNRQIPCYKIMGGRTTFKRTEVEEWIKQYRVAWIDKPC